MSIGRDDINDLLLRFDPLTVEHLGSNMYSQLPNAVAELVANAYDADATSIVVRVNGTGGGQQILVEDDGHGMSHSDVREKYLRIGRNRRNLDPEGLSESRRRNVSGKKGLGKLALFGVGHHIVVTTTRAGSSESLVLTMNWDDLISTESGDYQPGARVEHSADPEHGTCVKISQLARQSDIHPRHLAESLSRLFHYNDSKVSLTVTGRDGSKIPVTRELRLESIDSEFGWRIPDDLSISADALANRDISGRIISAEKPLKAQTRGITVYVNGRLANEPEFFGAADSSYAYAYLTGYVEVNFLDTIKPDVVATDRRAIAWENQDAAQVRSNLRKMVEEIAQQQRQWRREKKEKHIEDKTGIKADEWPDTIKGPEQKPLKNLLGIIESEQTEMSNEDQAKMVEGLHGLAPPYADMVWRHLHPAIQRASEHYFKSGDYHQALTEGCKAYVRELREQSEISYATEHDLFGLALGEGKSEGKGKPREGRRLKIAHPFISGTPAISGLSANNLENGQRDLAKALWSAFRNPLAHETIDIIRKLDVITYHDCLDALSLMSHLCRRLDDAKPAEDE